MNLDELNWWPFKVSLDRYDDSYKTVEDPFGWICVPNKTEDINVELFNMMEGINESKHNKTYFKGI